jgi:hypothetical protein
VSRCGARRPSVRPSAHNTPLGCVWYYCHCQLVVASGASGGTFSRLFLSLSRHHILPWSLWANSRKMMYCMQASSETIDSCCVWESQNLWEELVESNPIYIFPCCRCFAFRRWVVDLDWAEALEPEAAALVFHQELLQWWRPALRCSCSCSASFYASVALVCLIVLSMQWSNIQCFRIRVVLFILAWFPDSMLYSDPLEKCVWGKRRAAEEVGTREFIACSILYICCRKLCTVLDPVVSFIHIKENGNFEAQFSEP